MFLFLSLMLSWECIGHGYSDESPEDLTAHIGFPYENDRIRGLVPVYGIADGKNFKQYRLEFGEGEHPSRWEVIKVSSEARPVDPFAQGKIRWNPDYGTRGNLGDWEVGAPPYEYSTWKRNLNGRYTLRLVVENQKGETSESRVTVSVGQVLTFLDGGRVTSPDGRMQLTAPPHSLVYGPFAVVCLFPTAALQPVDGYQAVGPVYEFQPPNFQAIKPMQLSARFQASDLVTDGHPGVDTKSDPVGLYYYEPVEKVWVRFREQSQPSFGQVNATLTRTPQYVSYMAVLADTRAPDPPLLLAKEEHGRLLDRNPQGVLESHSPWITFFGRAEPDAVILLRSGDEDLATTEADLAGKFSFQELWSGTAPVKFHAVAVDRSGRESRPSYPLQCQWSPAQAPVSSLAVLGLNLCGEGEWVVVKAETKANEDGNTGKSTRSLAARVSSSVTDPAGIPLELRPVSGRANTFVGSFQVGSRSDPYGPQLAARSHAEAVRIEMPGAEITTELSYQDRFGPAAPAIISTTHPSALQTWFDAAEETGPSSAAPVLGWTPVDGKFGAQLSIRKPEEKSGKPDATDELKATTSVIAEPETENQKSSAPQPPVYLHAKPTPEFPNHLGLDLPVETFQVSEFPMLSFDYRFHPDLPLDLLLKTAKHGWKGIRLAGQHAPLYERLAAPDDFQADGHWHHAQVALDRILKEAYPAESDWEIQAMRLQSWKKAGFKRLQPGLSFADFHIYYDLARFHILRYGVGARVHLKWTAAGAGVAKSQPIVAPNSASASTDSQTELGTTSASTDSQTELGTTSASTDSQTELGATSASTDSQTELGATMSAVPGEDLPATDTGDIAGYSFTLDRSPWTVPEPLEKPVVENEKIFEAIQPGAWYFHVRAVDRAGNWGKTAHYELRVSADKPGDIAFEAPEERSLKWPAPIVLTTSDPRNLIPQSLAVSVAGRRFTTAEKALHYEVDSGRLIFQPDLVEPSAWIFPDGLSIPVVVEAAAGFDGASLAGPLRFDITYASALQLDPSNAAAAQVSPLGTSVPGANLPSAWFRTEPALRVKESPEGSSFRWLAQPEVENSAPQIRTLQLRFPASWFSGPAQRAHRGQDFIPCVWSLGLLPGGPAAQDAFVWQSGGLLGSYFRGPLPKPGHEEAPLVQRVDPAVFYSMNDASALPVVPQASSARWQGMLYVPFTDEWSFDLHLGRSSDSVTVTLGDDLVLTTKDQWHPAEISGRRFLARGFYPVLIEISSSSPGWFIEWFWEAEDWRTRRRVPAEHLFARLPVN